MSEKYLIVGLGNMGREYEKTRHNAGFWVIDELVKRYALGQPSKARKSLLYEGLINNKRVVLAKPQTYMNLSGEAVRALIDFYKIETAQMLIVHDDLDLPLGTLRLRKDGSAGGQNGVKNIILHTGTQNFGRLRFGIGRPEGRIPARDYVLQAFLGDDAILAQQVTDRAADAVVYWLEAGIELAMTRYNGTLDEIPRLPPAPTPKPSQPS